MTAKTLDATSYNNLLYVDIASQLFTNRDEMLSKLEPVLKQYGNNRFGVCLVHRHCLLEEGERMVANGNISQPERDGPAYPERWLATGEAYEFSREATTSPSEELLENFRGIVGDINVLGLFYIRDEDKNGIVLERTEGRRNITNIIAFDTAQNALTTAWHLTLSGGQFSKRPMNATFHACSLCMTGSSGHTTNANKMEELMRRRDLGHDITGVGAA